MVDQRIKINKNELYVTCDSDVRLDELFQALEKSELKINIYPMKSPTTNIGDWIDSGYTGNIGSYKYGTLNQQIRSIKEQINDDTIIETGFKAISNFSSSYNLNALFAGTRKLLGNTLAVTLKLHPTAQETVPLSYDFKSFNDLFLSLKKIIKSAMTPYNISFVIVIENGIPFEISLTIAFEGPSFLINSNISDIESILVNSKKEDDVSALLKWDSRFIDSTLRRLGGSNSQYLGDWALPLNSANEFIEDIKAIDENISNLFIIGILIDRSTVIFNISALPKSDKQLKIDEVIDKIDAKSIIKDGHSLSWRKANNIQWLKSDMEQSHGNGFPGIAATLEKTIIQNIKSKRGYFSKMREDLPFIQKALVNQLGSKKVSIEDLELMLYTHDLAPLPNEMEFVFHRIPCAVVRPTTTEEIIMIVKLAKKYRVPLIPRGGASWGFGGVVPTQGGIVIDFTSMNNIMEINEENSIAVCQPGVTWEQLSEEVTRKGLAIGSYPGSAPIATIGGWLSTGGSGIASYKYGTAFDQVRAIKAVFQDGSLINTASKTLSYLGYYNLNSILIGAEGTVGVITEVALKLHPQSNEIKPLSYSFNDIFDIGPVLQAITHSPVEPYHISFLDGNHFRYLEALGLKGREPKIPYNGAVVNVVLDGSKLENDWNERNIDTIMKKNCKESVEFSTHEWEERAYELRGRRLGPGGVLGEVVVPVKGFNPMVLGTQKIIKNLRMESSINGVLVDRNTVVFMPYFITDERNLIKSLSSMGYVKKLIDLGISLDGRPSGMGIWFAGNIKKLHGKFGFELIKNIKYSMDPDDIMNPGKYTEIRTRFGVAIPPFLMEIMLNLMGMVKSKLPTDRIMKKNRISL